MSVLKPLRCKDVVSFFAPLEKIRIRPGPKIDPLGPSPYDDAILSKKEFRLPFYHPGLLKIQEKCTCKS